MKYLLLFIMLLPQLAEAQSFLDIKDKKGRSLYNDNWFNLEIRNTSVRRTYGKGIGGNTANINLRYANAEKGKGSWHYDNPTLSDFIWLVANIKKDVQGSYGAGFLGWMQTYYNVIATDKFILAPGFSIADYIYATKRPEGVLEPNGYYLHLGPSIKTSYLINKDLWVDGFTTIDMGVLKGKPKGANQSIDNYPNPIFVTVAATVYHSSRFYLTARYNQIIDRGINKDKANRLDVSLGYQILH
jgi:hypothetical protein